jgi:hypothetical protein
LTSENLYTYYIDNQRTSGHHSVIFSLRELSSMDMESYCSNISIVNQPLINEEINFTSNYELRIYTSGCYYLDGNDNWQSDGLLVSFEF